MIKKYLVVICGPTAVGKTKLAIEVAKEFNSEIISADSRQFFREMNIGTAKPTAEELSQAKHHFINSLSVTDDYNVGMFERDALQVLEKIFCPIPKGRNTNETGVGLGSLQGGPKGLLRRGQTTAIMVSGSGLYINAVCNGFDAVPEADKELRKKLSTEYKEGGIETLQRMLKKLDPEHYRKVDIKNPHRLIRAIEVCMITGKKYSELRQREKKSPPTPEGEKVTAGILPLGTGQTRSFRIIKIGLNMEREKLYKRINDRVDKMIDDGLLDEVRSLAPFRAGAKLNSLQTVGYTELFDHLEGKYDLSRAVELIKQNTRNFAKRQMTWFKKDKEITWFEPGDKGKILEHIKAEVLRLSGEK